MPSNASSLQTSLAAAHDAAGAQHYPKGTLYLVPTPIGNLADITLRALHVLSIADRVACEDTRHTRQLLLAYGIDKPSGAWLAAHQHNEREAASALLAHLAAGERVAYASDAGTPGISDPGARLVEAVRAAGLGVVALPGASSVTCAVSASGLAGDGHFVFLGFLGAKSGERQQAVQAVAAEPRAQVLLEAPHRIAALARELAPLDERLLTCCRELTKQHEQVHTLPAREFADWLAQDPQRQRGEFVLVVHPAARSDEPAPLDTGVLELLLEQLPLKSAARLAAQITGQPRNALYEAALKRRKVSPHDD